MNATIIPELLKLLGAIFVLGWGLYRIFKAPKPLVKGLTVQVIVSFIIAAALLIWTHYDRLSIR